MGQREQQSLGRDDRHDDRDRERQRPAPSTSAAATCHTTRAGLSAPIGRDPLEQRRRVTNSRTSARRDRVEHHHALMREDDGREQRLPQRS